MDILTGKSQGILTIEFNRPDKKNAITSAMYQALADAIQDGEQDQAVRVILITGKGDVFTAGNDLDDFIADPPSYPGSPVFHFMHQLSHAGKAVVAAVNGAAIGIGTTMLLHCDIVYAADTARFALPFTRLGLCPEFAASLLLPQLAGYHRAAEKLLLGDAFTAQEAQEMGLVGKVLEAGQLSAYAQSQCTRLAALPASSLILTKRLMKSSQAAAVEARMAEENKLFSELLDRPEAQEAIAAFFKK